MSDAPKPWYDAYDDETKAFVTAKGYVNDDMPTAIAKAIRGWQSAEKYIGVPADQVLRMPKDAADPLYQTAYERIMALAVPTKPEEYVFDGVRRQDGTPLDADEQKALRDMSVKHKLTLDQARGLAADYVAQKEASGAEQNNQAATRRAANDIALRQTWNTEHDQKLFQATRAVAAAGFADGTVEGWAALDTPKYIANMNAMVALSAALNDATILRGGGIPRQTPGSLDGAGAQRRLDDLMADKGWGERYLNGDRSADEEYKQLRSIIANANVAARSVRP